MRHPPRTPERTDTIATQHIVESARAAMGSVGAKFPSIGISDVPTFAAQRTGMRRLEAAGYDAAWNGEGVGGKDAFVELAVLLAATERMVFSSSVANMYARPAPTAHGAAAMLSDAFPGRFVLGLGPGYPFQAALAGQQSRPPLARTREYIDALTTPQPGLNVPEINYATIVAANGPKMVSLAGEIADGVQPTVVPPWAIRQMRDELGPGKLIVVGLVFATDDDRGAARAIIQRTVAGVAGFPGSPYAANLVRLGYPLEELQDGTDRVLNDIAAFGTCDDIAAAVERFLEAGADHVIMTPLAPDYEACIDQLVRIAPAVTALGR